jgi:hypothetical protein
MQNELENALTRVLRTHGVHLHYRVICRPFRRPLIRIAEPFKNSQKASNSAIRQKK